MNKQEIREDIKKSFAELGEKLLTMSVLAEKRLMELPEYVYAKSVLIYMPLNDEVDTLYLLADALKMKNVYVPHTAEVIFSAKIKLDSDFVPKKYGIFEPKELVIDAEAEIDLVVVPLRAFDRNKNRMGRGKGYYDKFLNNFRGVKIGLAFSFQEICGLPVEAHDVKLDKIVTEKEVIF